MLAKHFGPEEYRHENWNLGALAIERAADLLIANKAGGGIYRLAKTASQWVDGEPLSVILKGFFRRLDKEDRRWSENKNEVAKITRLQVKLIEEVVKFSLSRQVAVLEDLIRYHCKGRPGFNHLPNK